MSRFTVMATAAALLMGASCFTVAQAQSYSSSTSRNAAASGGSGTHRDTPKTGSAETNAKILHNQNGYR